MIWKLPEEVVRKIAAGEVVTGAFSVVKELVENSLDAGAKRVEIEIKDGGKSSVKVRDDGEGMDLEDMELAILPHTTSKIKDLEDIYKINTYGFRGEALSAIARVSKMVITSRKGGKDRGNRIHVVAGEIVEIEKELIVQEGTTITVTDLFFNVPARRKFLKSSKVESRMVIEQVQKFLLSRPDVHFVLISDGVVIYNTPPVDDMRVRMALVAPDAKPNRMIDLKFQKSGIEITGLVSHPSAWRKTRSGMFVFVNGRYVLDGMLLRAIERGYGESLQKGRHPICAVFLKLDHKDVDVNVHPQKIEVKFSKPEDVSEALERAVAEALRSNWKGKFESRVRYTTPRTRSDTLKFKEMGAVLEMTRTFEEVPRKEISAVPRVLMVLRDRYILAEDEDGIIVVDYHAAHERLIYEKLRSEYETGIGSSYLVIPIDVELDEVLISVAREKTDLLERLGFRFEINERGLRITAVPSVLPVDLAQETILETLEELRLSRFDLPETVKRILANLACKRAVKTGDSITSEDAQEILMELSKRGLISCPHGRPLVFKLSFDDLDRYFERG